MALKPIYTSTTYKISLEELKNDYAEQLGVTPDKISIKEESQYKPDSICCDSYRTLKGLIITVNQ